MIHYKIHSFGHHQKENPLGKRGDVLAFLVIYQVPAPDAKRCRNGAGAQTTR